MAGGKTAQGGFQPVCLFCIYWNLNILFLNEIIFFKLGLRCTHYLWGSTKN